MSDSTSNQWIDACVGLRSTSGHSCEYLAQAIATWNESRWKDQPASPQSEHQQSVELEQRIVTQIRELTGGDETTVNRCLSTSSIEQALQWVIVLSRKEHSAASPDSFASAKCLSAVGSDHGDGVVGRMASGRAESRDPAWPILPGFDHVPLNDLAKRINEQTAMVLISPIDWNAMAKAIDAKKLEQIGKACRDHGAVLVIDHSQIPPMGGGHFFVHESIAGESIEKVRPDAILLSAGLLGGIDGCLLVLAERLASMTDDSTSSFQSNPSTATLAAASLQQWIDNDWLVTNLDEFSVDLAQRLAVHETIRDMHVTGRTIGIEMDMPAADWIAVATDCRLQVRSAGEFAIGLQPELVSDDLANSALLDRIDKVFHTIAAKEQEKEVEEPDQLETLSNEATDNQTTDSETASSDTEASVTEASVTEATVDVEDTIDAENTADTGASP